MTNFLDDISLAEVKARPAARRPNRPRIIVLGRNNRKKRLLIGGGIVAGLIVLLAGDRLQPADEARHAGRRR